MISWLEKNNKFSLLITILLAIAIFYFSSIQFTNLKYKSSSFQSYVYHLTIFFLFSFFFLLSTIKGNKRNKKFIFYVMLLSIIYGILDEIHQFFVPYRSFSFLDIITDSIGVILSSLIYTLRLLKKD